MQCFSLECDCLETALAACQKQENRQFASHFTLYRLGGAEATFHATPWADRPFSATPERISGGGAAATEPRKSHIVTTAKARWPGNAPAAFLLFFLLQFPSNWRRIRGRKKEIRFSGIFGFLVDYELDSVCCLLLVLF
jgi:hypothetical protein